MKTVLVNHIYEPGDKITGITTYLFQTLEELIKLKEFNYILITTWSESELPRSIKAGCSKIITVPFVRSTPLNLFVQSWHLLKAHRKYHFDIEFSPNPLGSFKFGNWQRVFVVHDLYMYLFPGDYNLRYRLYSRIFLGLNLYLSSSVICVSKATQDLLNRFHNTHRLKSIVIHEASKFKRTDSSRSIPKSHGKFLLVANISANKGVDILQQALEIASARGYQLTVLHVGRDETHAVQYTDGLGGGIIKIGRVTTEELISLYEDVVALVVPSKNEGFCLPVAEAQALGTPIIANDIDVFREVAGDGAIFYRENDPLSLAEEMINMLENPELQLEISKLAWCNSENFSWHISAVQTLDVFNQTPG